MDYLSKDNNYKYIVSDIMDNENFLKLEKIPHHDSSRLNHSIKVSYYSYKISKALKLDYKQTARAALLHDFYFDRTKDYDKVKDKVKLYTTGHPADAVTNATKEFDLTIKEQDIIKTHMFPIDFRIPKYLEGWVVNLVDTCVSIHEFSNKFKYQINTALNLWLVLFINLRK